MLIFNISLFHKLTFGCQITDSQVNEPALRNAFYLLSCIIQGCTPFANLEYDLKLEKLIIFNKSKQFTL